jgi:hypothetical protein
VANDKKISEKRKRQCSKLVDISKGIVRQVFDRFKHEKLGITWTGGKDSTLTLWIIRQVCQEKVIPIPKTMIIGEGDDLGKSRTLSRKSKKSGVFLLRFVEMRMFLGQQIIH